MTPVEEFFSWIEHTALSQWVVGESLLAFPLILSVHTIGMGLVAGFGFAMGVRILGYAPGVPVAALEKFYPVFWIAFAANAASGVLLLAKRRSALRTLHELLREGRVEAPRRGGGRHRSGQRVCAVLDARPFGRRDGGKVIGGRSARPRASPFGVSSDFHTGWMLIARYSSSVVISPSRQNLSAQAWASTTR